MKKLTLFFLFLSLITLACKDDITQPTRSRYAGNWSVTFTGSAGGSASMTVISTGNFNFGITLHDFQNQSYSYNVSGFIDSDGNVNSGQITSSGNVVGSFTGQFSTTMGSGTWTAGPNGSWSAAKQ